MIGNRITLYSVTNTDIASKGGSGTKHGTAGGAVVFFADSTVRHTSFFLVNTEYVTVSWVYNIRKYPILNYP